MGEDTDDVSRRLAMTVDGEHLVIQQPGALRRITAADLFSVVVVWSENQRRWSGWLTTHDRWSVRFAEPNLEDGALVRWLSDLPDWEPSAWSLAVQTPGIHLVW